MEIPHNWVSYSPALLKQPKHSALESNSSKFYIFLASSKSLPFNCLLQTQLLLEKTKTKPMTQVLSDEKKELIELQKKYFVNLNENAEEERSLKINFLIQEYEWKKKQAAEKHEWKKKLAVYN